MRPNGSPLCHCYHDQCCGMRDLKKFEMDCKKCEWYKGNIKKELGGL